MAHAILAILLASAIAATFVGRRASNAVSQGRCLVPWILCGRLLRRLSSTIASVIAADRRRRRREEASDHPAAMNWGVPNARGVSAPKCKLVHLGQHLFGGELAESLRVQGRW